MDNNNLFLFNIRVYGLIINQHKEILISDEYQLNQKMTKFPGGGMKYGEGTIDCLKREISEECNGQEIKIIRHFYTTDFYQKALFYKNQQLISIYYLANLKKPIKINFSKTPFDFFAMKNRNLSFRWLKIIDLKPEELSFPIDRYVVSLLKQKTDIF